ncbi:hypothetical protein HN873_071176 [Arachis hypogaea]
MQECCFASCDLYPHVHQRGPYIESELISFLGSAGSLFDLTLPLFRGNDTRTNFVIHLREAHLQRTASQSDSRERARNRGIAKAPGSKNRSVLQVFGSSSIIAPRERE